MHSRVLQVPELLSIIFSHADKQSNAACAIVCKQWLEPALNELWRNVEDPTYVFKLLAPMHDVGNMENDDIPQLLFSRFVLPSDWARFEFYANRIRYLNFSELDGSQRTCMDSSVLAEIARTRPKLDILPKLRRLVWKSQLLSEAILFMSESVTHLKAKIDAPFYAGEGFLEPRAFLLDSAARLPNLTCLNIQATFSVGHVQDALLNLIGCSLKLSEITLPRYWVSSAVLLKLANSPSLKVVQWEYNGQGVGDRRDVESFRVSPHNGAFPALLDLSLEVHLHAAIELVENPFFPDRLTNLFVDTIVSAPLSEIQRFLTSCSTKFRALTLLHLDLQSLPHTRTSESSIITLETLQPVLDCPELTDFTLLHNEPLAITDSDVKLIASKLPSLRILFLNHQPTILSTPPITLTALLHLAQHCPHLEQLGVYLDATAAIPSVQDPQPFTALQDLLVGLSPIRDVDGVALFLSRVCAETPFEIASGVGWDDDLSKLLDPQVHEEHSVRHSVWESVSTCLPMLVAMRVEERSRSRQLEQELERLRTRNRLLETNVLEPSSMG